MARGKAPSLSNPLSILPDGSWTEQARTGGFGRGHMEWVVCGGADYRGAQVKGQCPLST